MDTLLNAVIPIFGLMAAGFAVGRFGVLGAGASAPLNRFVFYCALPALLFRAVALAPLADVLRWDFILVFSIGIAVIAGLALVGSALLFNDAVAPATMRAVNTSYGNVGYLGIPLAAVAYGEKGVVVAGITIVLNTVLIIAPATALFELSARREADGGRAAGGALLAIATNPLILAIILGLALSAGGASLPTPFDAFLKLLGDAAGPTALFALGLYISGRPLVRLYGQLAFATLLKLAVFPALVWGLALWVVPLEPMWAALAVLMAGTPIGAGSFVLAERYGIDTGETSTAIVVTTALSVPTLAFLLIRFSG
jgi:hypothetical protein